MEQLNQDKNQFKLNEFNKSFDQILRLAENQQADQEAQILQHLNQPRTDKPLLEQSIGEIMIHTKDTIFDLMYDILTGQWDRELFTKRNRMYYLGIMCLIIAILIHLWGELLTTQKGA